MGRITLASMVFVLAGCAPTSTRSDAEPKRENMMLQTAEFDYIVRDEQGTELVRGRMTLPWPIREGQTVRGSWESRYVGPSDPAKPDAAVQSIGPQVGRGTLSASGDGKEVRINLNPQMSDNNVTFSAVIEGGVLRGSWDYSTFVGTTASGPFIAQQKN